MHGFPDEVWKSWERKRRHTFIGLLFVGFIMGLDLSAIFTTMYLYLKEVVHTESPNVYYGIILGCFNICSMVSCILIGRWLDRTRKVRLYAHFALIVQIFGYLIYSVPLHPMFLALGRVFNGMSGTFVVVVSGELFRIYDEHEGVRMNFWTTAFSFVGVLLGPGIPAVFKGFELHIGILTINYLNFPGIVLSGLMVIALVVVNTMVHDCSSEIDLKEFLKRKHEEGNCYDKCREANALFVCGETPEQEDLCYLRNIANQDIPVKMILHCFVTNSNTLVIFIATFIVMYSVYSACVILPVIMQINLKWDIRVISLIIVGYGISGLLLISILGRFLNSARSVFKTSLFSIICQAMACCTIALLHLMEIKNIYLEIIILSFEVNFLIIGWFFADTLLRVTLARLVPSKIQSFSECLRAGVLRCAIIFASFIAPNVMPFIEWWSVVVFGIIIVLFGAYIVHRKQFIEPKEIYFDGYTILTSPKIVD